LKYKKGVEILYENMKNEIKHKRVIIQWHVIAVSSLSAFDKYLKEELERILGAKVKKTINILGKRLIVAALKRSFAIWLKKCGYNHALSKRPLSTLQWVNGTEDYLNPETGEDVITQASQVSLFQEVNMQEPDNYDFEEQTPIISNVIEVSRPLPQFQAVMEEEVIILDNIDHPDCEQV
jgi:hypothetical protein